MKKNTKGLKLIKRYGAPNIITGVLSMVIAAIAAAIFFLPVLTIKINEAEIVMTGYQVLKGGLVYVNKSYLPDLLVNYFNMLDSQTLNLVYPIFFTVLAGVYALGIIWAFIEFIFTLVMLVGGRLRHWKGPYGFSWGMIVTLLIMNGLVFLLRWYINKEFEGLATVLVNEGDYKLYIYFGISFVVMLVLGIIYAAAFKNRIYEKDIDNYSLELTPDKGQIFEVKEGEFVSYKWDMKKPVPYQLTYIPDHAFSKNVQLQNLEVPGYVRKICPGAFANCINLKTVELPSSLMVIEYNAFFNCKSLESITFKGKKEQFKKIKRGKNWLAKAGCKKVKCLDGIIKFN